MDELQIFSEALTRIDPDERVAYLTQACGENSALRERVEKLLALHASDASILNRRPVELLGEWHGRTMNIRSGHDPSAPESAADSLTPFLSPSVRPGSLGRLGHYDVLEVLGRGGFGIVVKAFDDSLHRVVAIKILTPHLAEISPPRKRFLREARATAMIKHDNVVRVYAVEEQPLPYLVMEYVEGQTLHEKLDRAGPLEPAEVVRLGCQIAQGLAAAHEKGLIHRDVKPANVLIEAGSETRAKLTDFGLARTADDASLTQSGVIAGTPLYMSPEQARGEDLDQRGDLFSLGSVLYTMTTGHPPFRAPNTVAVLRRVVEDSPRPIQQVQAGIPDGLSAVVMRLLEKDPGKRFATARETADALADCLIRPPVPPPATRRSIGRLVGIATVVVLLAAAVGLGISFAGQWPGQNQTAGPVAPFEPAIPPQEAPVTPPSDPAFPPGAIVVTSPADDDTPGTLRRAIQEANTRHGEDTIVFDPAVFARPTTITLTSGQLELLDPAPTTITGAPAGVTITGDGKYRVFAIGDEKEPASARLIDLTVANGLADPAQVEPRGGGILVARGGGTIEMIGCTVRDCSAEDGGGLNNYGTATLINCTFARNRALSEGGAIKSYDVGARLNVLNCTFYENEGEVPRGGGGIVNRGGRCEIFNCLFASHPTGAITHTSASDAPTAAGNLTDDESSEMYARVKPNLRIGPLGRHGGPTETIPLLPGSPAVAAGDITHVPAGVKTDQRGRPRLRNGTLDVGAFQTP